jgi:hypothetical protein
LRIVVLALNLYAPGRTIHLTVNSNIQVPSPVRTLNPYGDSNINLSMKEESGLMTRRAADAP